MLQSTFPEKKTKKSLQPGWVILNRPGLRIFDTYVVKNVRVFALTDVPAFAKIIVC